MRSTPAARLLLSGLAAVALIAGPTSTIATANSAQLPVVTSVTYGDYQSPNTSLQADTLSVDWAGTALNARVYCAQAGCTTNNVQFQNITSVFRDTGTPRSRLSYQVAACDPACTGAHTTTFGPWTHPAVPTAVNAAPPSLTATPGTKASPGMKITVTPGAQAGAPVFLIFNENFVIGRVGPANLTFIDSNPYEPLNHYSVAGCYADCQVPDWPYWGDAYDPVSAHSATTTAYTANTVQCKTLGRMLYAFGQNWRNACKP